VPPHYAGFWRRFVADVIDTLILELATWPIQAALAGAIYGVYVLLVKYHGGALKPYDQAMNPFLLQVLGVIIYLILSAIYFVWGQRRYGTTFGKRVFRIYVVQMADKSTLMTLRQAWLRYFGYFVSYATLGAGFLMVGTHPQKRGLHDLLAGTVSVIKD
jgi:uncharacterized RDD family membrane protein YckC